MFTFPNGFCYFYGLHGEVNQHSMHKHLGPIVPEIETLTIVNILSQHVSEETICPLPGVGVQCSVEVIFADGFGVNYVGHALHTLKPLQSLQ